MRSTTLILSLFFLLTNSWSNENKKDNYVWWEAEEPLISNFSGHRSALTFDEVSQGIYNEASWRRPSGETGGLSAATLGQARQLLSGNDWLSSTGKRGRKELFARYRVNVPTEGSYNFWVRKFWQHGPFKWRFNNEPWHICGRDIALADSVYLRKYICANWVYLGRVKLRKGKQDFEIRLLAGPGEDTTSAFDCFLLIPGPFRPNGKWKPDEIPAGADSGFFAYNPSLDRFGSDALLDLRYLNEKQAGQNGFIRRKGSQFFLGDGHPVRFWGVNVVPNDLNQDKASIDYLARRLAKLGVNMVRFHGNLFDGSSPTSVDRKSLDSLFYLVAALKREGIYTSLSFYYPLWFPIQPGYDIDDYAKSNNKFPFAAVYFDPRFQDIYRMRAKTLLTTQNPYTGLPLARDPAVGIIELVNEDSFFFWTFSKDNIPEVLWRELEILFGRWLTKRYGSLLQVFASWNGAQIPEDNVKDNRAGLYEAWHLTSDGIKRSGTTAKVKRLRDEVRFLAELQKGFYASMTGYIKKELNFGGLISAGNWIVTDTALLDSIERYTYTAADVVDQHGYFGGGSGYSVNLDDPVDNVAAVSQPEYGPLRFFQVASHPQIISELGWPNPNKYRADAAFLSSAYGSLQGIGGIDFFAVQNNFLTDSGMEKFTASSPVVAGAFPANALQYRRGDLREAAVVFYQTGSPVDSYIQKPLIPSLRAPDPFAFYVGRVIRSFDENTLHEEVVNPAPFIDRKNKIIKSITGESRWDYGLGVVRVDTPRSQGVAGFLSKAGTTSLGNVDIESQNEFGAISVISLDKRPLSSSRKILVQAITTEQPYGYKVQNNHISNLGGPPMELEKIDAKITIRFKDSRPAKVIALDENGYATGTPVPFDGNNPLAFSLNSDTLYYVILRQAP